MIVICRSTITYKNIYYLWFILLTNLKYSRILNKLPILPVKHLLFVKVAASPKLDWIMIEPRKLTHPCILNGDGDIETGPELMWLEPLDTVLNPVWKDPHHYFFIFYSLTPTNWLVLTKFTFVLMHVPLEQKLIELMREFLTRNCFLVIVK